MIIKCKKGFTLVEIIVVLVILAILAAATIPSMLGFVKDAKNKSFIPEARAAYTAAKSIATEIFATTSNSTKPEDLGKNPTLLDAEIKAAIVGTGEQLGSDDFNKGVVRNVTTGEIEHDYRTDKMKNLLGSDAEGKVRVKLSKGNITYYAYKKNIGGEDSMYELINNGAVAYYEVTA